MAESANNREFSRSPVRVVGKLTTATGVVVEGSAEDLSMTGVRVSSPRSLPVGAACGVTLVLNGGAGEVQIQAKGSVVRVDDRGMAVVFDEVDEEGLLHLRNLILFNAPDTDKVEQEFADHVGLKRF